MDDPLTPEQQNLVIEDALRTYPITPMPRDITAQVIARMQTVSAPRPFRLTWNDVALGIVLSICMGAVWFSMVNLPPVVVAQVRKESILFYQYMLVNARWLVPALSFGLAALLSALTLPYLKEEWVNRST